MSDVQADGFLREGLRLHQAGNLAPAEKLFRKAIEAYSRSSQRNPRQPQVQNNLGIAWQAMGNLDRAESAYFEALRLDPSMALALNNLSRLRRVQGRFAEAIELARKAMAIAPDLAEGRFNLAGALNEMGHAHKTSGRMDEAMRCFNRAIEIDPNSVEAHVNRGIALLLSGEWEQGWEEYEWRWRFPFFAAELAKFDRPMWDGTDLSGRSILLHAEQGLGDAIQFSRYATILAERGARVALCVQAPLRSLLQSVPGVERVVARGDALPEHDVHCPLMRVPYLLGTTVQTVPARVPYVIAPKRNEIDRREDVLHVGLVWSSNPAHPEGAHKCCPLSELAPLAAVERACFYSLQLGPAAREAAAFPGMIDLSPRIIDFSDTAAIIDNLDLVISVDTAVCHLAGAIGKRTFTLLASDADWRWLRGREDSPWYPTMRLFRQATPGDWAGVVARVVSALEQL